MGLASKAGLQAALKLASASPLILSFLHRTLDPFLQLVMLDRRLLRRARFKLSIIEYL